MPKLPQDVLDWPAEWRELYLERAAIMQFEGNMSKFAAERLAEQDTRRTAERSHA